MALVTVGQYKIKKFKHPVQNPMYQLTKAGKVLLQGRGLDETLKHMFELWQQDNLSKLEDTETEIKITVSVR